MSSLTDFSMPWSSFILHRQAVILCREQFHFAARSFYRLQFSVKQVYFPVSSFTFPWAVLLCREVVLLSRVSSFTFPWAILICCKVVLLSRVSSFTFPWAILLCSEVVLLSREQFYFPVSSFTLPWSSFTFPWAVFLCGEVVLLSRVSSFTFPWAVLLCREAVLLSREQFYFAVR